jgi:serine/threonine-protein kinase
MAPEQLAGTGASVRSDLYALGLVLYELFTGQRVFAAASVPELLRLRLETAIVPPRELVRELDPAVERAILGCLKVRSDERPESALAVLADLSGGDRLKAALAAGQTPSPSAVAGAPVRGALSPLAGWACLLTVVVACRRGESDARRPAAWSGRGAVGARRRRAAALLPGPDDP